MTCHRKSVNHYHPTVPHPEIKPLLRRLQRLMYGYNYEVTLGVTVFDACSSTEDFKANLKKEFPKSQPDKVQLVEMAAADLWETIQAAFDYRGDAGAGLKLSEEKESNLKEEQKKYFGFLKSYLGPGTKVFNYPDETGIPGYPVYWDFRFLVMTPDKKCLFIYGSASD